MGGREKRKECSMCKEEENGMLRLVSLDGEHVTFKLTYKLSCAQIWCTFVVMIDEVKKKEKKESKFRDSVPHFGFLFLCSEIPPATATATVREARAGVTQGQARGG